MIQIQNNLNETAEETVLTVSSLQLDYQNNTFILQQSPTNR